MPATSPPRGWPHACNPRALAARAERTACHFSHGAPRLRTAQHLYGSAFGVAFPRPPDGRAGKPQLHFPTIDAAAGSGKPATAWYDMTDFLASRLNKRASAAAYRRPRTPGIGSSVFLQTLPHPARWLPPHHAHTPHTHTPTHPHPTPVPHGSHTPAHTFTPHHGYTRHTHAPHHTHTHHTHCRTRAVMAWKDGFDHATTWAWQLPIRSVISSSFSAGV